MTQASTGNGKALSPTVCLAAVSVYQTCWTPLFCHMDQTDTTTRLGVLCIILGVALGIANIFHFNLLILFSILLL